MAKTEAKSLMFLSSFQGGCGGNELHNLGFWDEKPTKAQIDDILDTPLVLSGGWINSYRNKNSMLLTLRDWLEHPMRTLTIATSAECNGEFVKDFMEALGFKAMNVASNPYIGHPFQTTLTFWFLPPANMPENFVPKKRTAVVVSEMGIEFNDEE